MRPSPAAAVTLVGVGPGAPNLLTLAAVQAIESADVVAYPVARADAEGMAAQIAAPWITAEQRRLPLLFPMVAEAEPRQQAWREAADALAAEAEQGLAVVLLCEGMPPCSRAAPTPCWPWPIAIPRFQWPSFQASRPRLRPRRPLPVRACPGPWPCNRRGC